MRRPWSSTCTRPLNTHIEIPYPKPYTLATCRATTRRPWRSTCTRTGCSRRSRWCCSASPAPTSARRAAAADPCPVTRFSRLPANGRYAGELCFHSLNLRRFRAQDFTSRPDSPQLPGGFPLPGRAPTSRCRRAALVHAMPLLPELQL